MEIRFLCFFAIRSGCTKLQTEYHLSKREGKKEKGCNTVQLLREGDPVPGGEVEVGEGRLPCARPHVMDVNQEGISILQDGKLVITKRQIRLLRGFCFLQVC